MIFHLKSSVFTSKFSKINKINNFRLILRYASSGIQKWDQPFTTEIKLEVENYWKDRVAEKSVNRNNNDEDKVYVLSMFPYPSGSLHMGHVRVYTLSDTFARYYRMNGKNVIHPIGWDAFGLPAENAAIENNVNPAEWTKKNIDYMRDQLKSLRCSFDWEREISTCDPEYYKWTQELFIKLFEHKLIYKKQAVVNWDPVDKTVLANEQVSPEGISWRSGVKVEKKFLNQWFVNTTCYAKQLYDGLDDPSLLGWKDVKKAQKHWIGECTGTTIDFELSTQNTSYPKTFSIWTDKPEFLDQVKFFAISEKHVLNEISNSSKNGETRKLPDVEMINPWTKERIPVFVTKEIEFPQDKASHLRDDHLGIPCDSEKDAKFCEKIGIEFEKKILEDGDKERRRNEVLDWAKSENFGGFLTSVSVKDWLISRQRYWGTPIPMVYCEDCGDLPVPREELPVVLPELGNVGNDSKNRNLSSAKDWLQTKCPKCGGPGKREEDTMDTFVDSSWYFMRFLDPKNKEKMFDEEKVRKLLPVDLYIGGKEHACLHLYYSRFVSHFLHSLGLVPTREPFQQLLNMGMILGVTYQNTGTKKYLSPLMVTQKEDGKCYEKFTGMPVTRKFEKMSKSKYNGVDPMELFSIYSSDTVRLSVLEGVLPGSDSQWSEKVAATIHPWEHKLWLLVQRFNKMRENFADGSLQVDETKVFQEDKLLCKMRNELVANMFQYFSTMRAPNMAIERLKNCTARLRKISESGMATSKEFERTLAAQIIMMAPLAPHFASELWAGFQQAPNRLINDGEIKYDKDLLDQDWPEVDMHFETALKIHINQSPKFLTVKVPRKTLVESSTEEILKFALENKSFRDLTNGREILDVDYDSCSGLDAVMKVQVDEINEKILQKTTI